MIVSILIPVYNEEVSLKRVLEVVAELPIDKEILVIDDGSTDRTPDVLKPFESRKPFRVFRHHSNQGKGGAIQTGLRESRGDIVVIQDADEEYDARQILGIVKPIQEGAMDVVFGSRFLRPNSNIYKRYLWGNKFLTWLINLLCCSRLTDSYTCYKAFRKPFAVGLNLQSRGFEIEAEMAVKVLLSNARFQEIPIVYRPRSIEEGKKIGWRDAVKGVYTIAHVWWQRKRG